MSGAQICSPYTKYFNLDIITISFSGNYYPGYKSFLDGYYHCQRETIKSLLKEDRIKKALSVALSVKGDLKQSQALYQVSIACIPKDIKKSLAIIGSRLRSWKHSIPLCVLQPERLQLR